jgi:hypothetical protein
MPPLIEILWSLGRSVKVKRKLLNEMMALPDESGLNLDHVMVVLRKRLGITRRLVGG